MIAVHDRVNSETTNAQLAATAGLRKNLNVSKPSIGASFHAPPNADRPDSLIAGGGSPFQARLAAGLVVGALAGAGGAHQTWIPPSQHRLVPYALTTSL